MPRRRSSDKPILPGFGWWLIVLFLLALLFGSFGMLARWTSFQRIAPAAQLGS